ncbi:MAG: thioredoxin family protein [Phycisphaeraceae bacterium]|nr:thioredoxin family protein [Phycisphaeraceae bacterium]
MTRRFMIVLLSMLFYGVMPLAMAQSTEPLTFKKSLTNLTQKVMIPSSPVKVSALNMMQTIVPGGKFVLAVTLDIQSPWHVNAWQQATPQELNYLIPTQIMLKDPPSWVTVGKMQKPPTHQLSVTYTGEAIDLPVLEKQATFFLPLQIASDVTLGEHQLTLAVTYQTCDDKSCLAPKTQNLIIPVTVGVARVFASADVLGKFDRFDIKLLENFESQATTNVGDANVLFDAFGLAFTLDGSGAAGLLALMGMAMIGGMLLNLTPCVLPVIPLKIMLLHKSAGMRSKGLLLGVFMSAGVMGFWLVLGIAIATLSGFSQVSQLFQYPLFTLGMGVLICVLAIGMCGLFSVNLPKQVYNFTPRHDTLTGSVLFGVMTAVLSTPCTGPFMGAAAAWSATQSASVTILVFAAIGAGMALPYLLLSAFPNLVKKMPAAGPVSVLVKEFLGLCLLAAGAYFLGVGINGLFTTAPNEPGLWHWWLVCLILASAGGWLAFRSLMLGGKRPAAIIWATFGVLMLLSSLAMGRSLTSTGPIDWVMYTPKRMTESQTQGHAVLVDFTAQWCLNCQVLEHQVLHHQAVVDLLKTKKIVPMKVDLTSSNPQGTALLHSVGRLTIPLLVIYDSTGAILFKSDAYTVGQVTSILEALP